MGPFSLESLQPSNQLLFSRRSGEAVTMIQIQPVGPEQQQPGDSGAT